MTEFEKIILLGSLAALSFFVLQRKSSSVSTNVDSSQLPYYYTYNQPVNAPDGASALPDFATAPQTKPCSVCSFFANLGS